MADINKVDIKMMQSQRLDDTDQGGGQMTSHEVVDGAVNNFFPDISRLDRVYGRVSLRKGFLAVQTDQRETYYGSHTILTRQALDPNVSVCFFSSEDWFDTRTEARNRIEAYLVKGPRASLTLWGNHYKGTSILNLFTHTNWPAPEVGDVLVFFDKTVTSNEQYARVIDVSSEIREFFGDDSNHTAYYRQIVTIEIGSQLEYDFVGEEIYWTLDFGNDQTQIHDTVAADASRYYGVATLSEDITANELQLRVDSINVPLVPSAQSETAITDAGVGVSVSPMLQTEAGQTTVTRSIQFTIAPNAKLYIGEGILPGTFQWSGGITLTDDAKGNVYNGSLIVGSITYATGIIVFGQPGISTSGTGTVTYVPACAPTDISETGGIIIETNNRGFVYTFNCNPLPQPGTLKIEFLASGKWYSLWDQGNGVIKGQDDTLGSGTVNFNTGSISVTLGAMPDVGSKVLFFWAKPAKYYDLSGENLPLRYKFMTNTPGVARDTFVFSWLGDAGGSGPAGEYAICDNGNTELFIASYNGVTFDWEPSGAKVGTIKYATGEVEMQIPSSGIYPPVASEIFTIEYNYGDKIEEEFFAPARDINGHITLTLAQTPIVPGSLRVEWHTDLEEYDPETRIDTTKDPTYIFADDAFGHLAGDVDDGTTGWVQSTVNYVSGILFFHPDRTSSFPIAEYEWAETAWLHPGVEETYMFSGFSYYPAGCIFPTEGTVLVSYYSQDGTNYETYQGNIAPIFQIRAGQNDGMEIIPGGLHVLNGSLHLLDGNNGVLYTHSDGVNNNRIEVGNIHYINKTVTITSDLVNIGLGLRILSCCGSGGIDPTMSLVFRSPGAPIRPGSAFIRATTGAGTIIEGQSQFSGEITGTGIFGEVDFNTGLCHVGFGEWVADDVTAQAADWYPGAPKDGLGNVWKPYSVRASTILFNCVVTSYLPLDPDLLGLDPVRLPLDGKVPIFRDGYIIVIHHSREEIMPQPLNVNDPLLVDQTESVGRTNVNLIEIYAMPTTAEMDEGLQTCPIYIADGGNYTVNLVAGTVTFLAGFQLPKDIYGTTKTLVALSRIEDMCLASDVQVTGHISVTSPITHDYPADETLVSSVLPSADLQSRAYNEFEQNSWSGVWLDYRPENIPEPLASYNFVDYPITVTNRPSIKERWLILFETSNTVKVVGQNFGVLATGVNIQTGNAIVGGYPCIAISNRNFPGEYYFVMRCDGFGVGWAAGNCIRFNEDAANFPLWFIRTTLQAPPTEPVDHYTIQIRGDSS